MSENKRKAARTQGRFSNEKEFRSTRHDKEKQSNQKSPKNESESPDQDENIKNPTSKPATTAEGITIQYQDNCTHNFTELMEEKNEEIREPGVHILSETENGISRIIYELGFIDLPEAAELMDSMEKSVPWSDKNIKIRGKEFPQPRQVAWYGPLPYSYSGAIFDAAEIPDYILKIKAKIEEFLRQNGIDVELNSVLLNLYRNGNDSVAWHSDDEVAMGVSPTIASLSLGAVRAFEMRPKNHVKTVHPSSICRVHLQPGSLLIMDGCMQKDWKHQVPKEYNVTKPRINLTFRTVYAITKIPTKVPYLESKTSASNRNITQPEHIYDPNSFPLLSAVNNQPKEKSSNCDITETNQEFIVQDISNISSNFEGMDETKIGDFENNLNKNVIHSEKTDNFSKYDKSMNLNLTESATASNSTHLAETPGDNECESVVENEEIESFKETVEPKRSLKKVNHHPEILNSPEDSKVFVDNEQNRKSHEMINKHQLNANAPDFIPKSIVDKMSCPKGSENFNGRPLKDLADVYLSSGIRPEDMKEFTFALMQSLEGQRNTDLFTPRDWFEFNVLIQLTHNGQDAINQHIINQRICTLTKYVSSKFDDRTPRYRQKPSYSGSKNLYYKSSSFRYGNI